MSRCDAYRSAWRHLVGRLDAEQRVCSNPDAPYINPHTMTRKVVELRREGLLRAFLPRDVPLVACAQAVIAAEDAIATHLARGVSHER